MALLLLIAQEWGVRTARCLLLLAAVSGCQSVRAITGGGEAGEQQPWLVQDEAAALADALAGEPAPWLEGMKWRIASGVYYDSNATWADGLLRPVESDWILSFAPSLEWTRRAGDFSVGLEGGLERQEYASLSEFSATNHYLASSLGYECGPLSLEFDLRESRIRGVDRYFGGVTDRSALAGGVKGNYRLSGKTRIEFSYAATSADTEVTRGSGTGQKTLDQRFAVFAGWQTSPLLSLGPGLRWTRLSSDSDGDRTSIGPSVKAHYRLTGKMDLSGTLGMDFARDPGGSSEEFVNAGLESTYRLNALWSFRARFGRDTTSQSNRNGGFQETTAIDVSIHRRIGRASLMVGGGREHLAFSNGSAMRLARPDVELFQITTALEMPLFGDRARGRVFWRLQDSSSRDPRRDGDGIQTGISLSTRF